MARSFGGTALKVVVIGQFLTRLDVRATPEENVSVRSRNIKVGFATVVDEFGAVALPRVNDPIAVQAREQDSLRPTSLDVPATCFRVVNFVAHILNDDPPAGDRFACEDAEMMDRRAANL
jgi:hypothetical protein